ncbi:MAG: hypothetical protein COB37_10560 [Kordiimonadales bacterium]|nr:MAG: hypothetical protein COB37_10560 [Kordiimonadales bacterium]
MRLPIIVFCTIIAAASVAKAQDENTAGNRDPAKLASFFQSFVGEWTCEGKSARGYDTAAKISVSSEYDGKVLTYRHTGLKGNTNQMIGIWSFDKPEQNLMVSRHFVAANGNFGDVYLGTEWSENRLVLTAKELWKPLWAENHFIYEITGTSSFKVTWEIKKDGAWAFGDDLACSRD